MLLATGIATQQSAPAAAADEGGFFAEAMAPVENDAPANCTNTAISALIADWTAMAEF